MSCSIDLKTLIPDATNGGQWELIGFSTTEGGTYGLGGNWPWSTNVNENPNVVLDDIIQGYYKLNYFTTGVCSGSQEIIVPVTGGGDAGSTIAIDICDSSIINIVGQLGTLFDVGVLQSSFIFTGSGVASGGFIENDVNTPLDNQFDTSLVSAGTYEIKLDIIPVSPTGYVLTNCCMPTSATLIINVLEENSITISIDDTCKIHVDSITGCDNATLQLYVMSGVSWVAVPFPPVGTIFPYQVDTVNDYKVIAEGCNCGDIESNIVSNINCCVPVTSNTWTITIIGCVMYLTGSGCGGGVKRWYKSCDAQQTWNHVPALDGLTTFSVTDDCFYQCIIECIVGPNTCHEYTNIVNDDCSTCDDTLTTVKNTCEYSVTAGPVCVSGEMQLFKIGTGVVDTIDLSTQSYPFDFPITVDGDYKAIFHCLTDGCPDIEGSIINYNEGCGLSCDSVLTATESSCLITAAITNCPSPTYTFKRPNGTIAYSGPNDTYVGDVDGTWTVLANGCPNCGELSDTVVLSGCEVNCNCAASISESTCALLTLDAQSCSGYAIEWEYKLLIGDSWTNAQNGGITHQGLENGFYQAVLTKSGCATITTNTIEVTCLTGCDCVPNITLIINTCIIEGTPLNCTGYALSMQHKLVGVWTDIGAFISPWTYAPIDNNLHRVKATKAGCPDWYSNIVDVQCVGGCQVVIDSFIVDPLDCTKAIVTWSGAGGSDVTLQFSYAQVNPTDCNTASGWLTWGHTGSGSFNANGTGNFTVNNIPECDKCIRVIVDAGNEGCSVATEKVFVPCCCTDEPTISEGPVNIEWVIRQYNSAYNENYIDVALINDSSLLDLTSEVRVYKGSEIVVDTTVNSTSGAESTIISKVTPNGLNLIDGSVLSQINFTDGAGVTILYVGLVYVGTNGTIVASELVFDSANPSIMQNALEINILNYLEGEGKDIEGLVVEVNGDGSFYLQSNIRNNPSNANLVYVGYIPLSLPCGLYTIPASPTETLICEFICPVIQRDVTGSSDCGLLETWRKRTINIIDNTVFDTDIHLLDTTFILDTVVSATFPTMRICQVNGLKVDDYCIGATFLWNTGETTDQIEASSGNYSCVITCPDECEYILNITI